MMIRLGLVQMSMESTLEANCKKASKLISEAAKKGANIVCLPELFTSPYFPQDEKTDGSVFAEEIPGESTRMLSDAAMENSVVLVGGSIYEKHHKKFYNTSVVFDEKGKLLGKYRKVHIPHDPHFYEKNYFSQGDLEFQIFETKYGKIAPLICYDQWFPEAARCAALKGADIIVYPTAIGLVKGMEQSEGNWQDAWTTVMRGHAIANNVAVAAVNRIGIEKNMQFWGQSFICSQFGAMLKKGSSKEEIIMADIDSELKDEIRKGWGFFQNRRPETYSRITEE